MKCPIDDSNLVMTERAGVEIDYCPQCRGVWLDRGELDKIIDRSFGESGPQGSLAPDDRSSGDRRESGHGQNYESGHGMGRGRRKENWLSDLFG